MTLLDEAHARGIRVITDLVLNHTSDTHRWFQESRYDPNGPYGDYYVWRDTDTDYAGVRVIFSDTEPSNWTFDPVRQQFYWHRFFAHQPDLNYDNPAVQEAMLDVVRFWLDLGIDGFRLDAVTYLFEREGTDCANLPETHAYLKRIRSMIDTEYPGRVMLAEANLWPTELIDYFGDEASRRRRVPHGVPLPADAAHLHGGAAGVPHPDLRDHGARRRQIPSGCQWGTFLRNHDELTLEMVTGEERDYMHQEYAEDPRARLNAGHPAPAGPAAEQRPGPDQAVHRAAAVAARLAGAVLRRRDRHGRQHLAGRPGRRPHPDAVVGRPQRRLLPGRPEQAATCRSTPAGSTATRPSTWSARSTSPTRCCSGPGRWSRSASGYRALAQGTFDDLEGSNPAVLSFLREYTDDDGNVETVLCVHNLSRHPQPVQLNLSRRFHNNVPVELTGGTAFPNIGLRPYLLTLPGYGSYWFSIVPARQTVPQARRKPAAEQTPTTLHHACPRPSPAPAPDACPTRARLRGNAVDRLRLSVVGETPTAASLSAVRS